MRLGYILIERTLNSKSRGREMSLFLGMSEENLQDGEQHSNVLTNKLFTTQMNRAHRPHVRRDYFCSANQ